MITIETLTERIKQKYDPDELVDLLDISVDDIMHHFGQRVLLYRDRFISEEYWEDGTEE